MALFLRREYLLRMERVQREEDDDYNKIREGLVCEKTAWDQRIGYTWTSALMFQENESLY